jgi:hypothetical protein
MTFDEISIRMLQLGVDRDWIAANCDYSKSHLANMLAPNGSTKHKTDKALRRIWEALDREEERQKNAHRIPAPLGHRVVIEPTDQQFDRWMRAAYSQPGRTFDQWAKDGLEEKAERELPILMAERTLRVAEPPADYPAESNGEPA